jgi:hypothetical protein
VRIGQICCPETSVRNYHYSLRNYPEENSSSGLVLFIKEIAKTDRSFLVWSIRFHCLFGPKRDEVTGEWRKLRNEELNDLYSSPSIVRVVKSRRMRWAGHVARIGENRGVHRVLVGKPEGKRPLGRPRHRWEDNIKMDF